MKLPPKLLVALLLIASAMLAGCENMTSASAPALPAKEGVYFITPRDGDVVTSPVIVRFGLKGKGVAPAGVAQANTGHHHLLIDEALPPMNVAFPSDAHHVHFGGGQTEASVTLAPGKHTLQLVLADHLHVPLGPAWVSEQITITVK